MITWSVPTRDCAIEDLDNASVFLATTALLVNVRLVQAMPTPTLLAVEPKDPTPTSRFTTGSRLSSVLVVFPLLKPTNAQVTARV